MIALTNPSPANTPPRPTVAVGQLAKRSDAFTIELRAFADATYPLVNKSYKPDDAASLVTDGLSLEHALPVAVSLPGDARGRLPNRAAGDGLMEMPWRSNR